MEARTNNVTDIRGNGITGAVVAVYADPTASGVYAAEMALATLYSDNGVTAKDNPFATDANGLIKYFAANGHYIERVTHPNFNAGVPVDTPIVLNDLSVALSESVASADADAVATAADRVQTGIDAAATAADRAIAVTKAAEAAASEVQTGLDAAATAADRVQTGIDATAAAAATGDGFLTKADMDAAAGSYTEGKVVRVTNDPTPAYNGEWRKGATVFAQSSFDRVAVVETALDNEAAATIHLEDEIINTLTASSAVQSVSASTVRFQSPEPAASLVVTPVFAGLDLDTPVVPVRVTVTGKNIVDPDPALWETGKTVAGANSASTSSLRTSGFIPVTPETQYSRRGLLKPTISLYDAAGTFTREINILIGTPDVFITTASEVQMRLYFVKTAAVPTDAVGAQIQVEASAVATAFEPYRSSAKEYDPLELYAYGGVIDRVTGNNLVRLIERRTVRGTATSAAFGILGPVNDMGSVYRAYIDSVTSPQLGAQTAGYLIGQSADGDYPPLETSATDARGIYGSARIFVEIAKIDAMPGADTLAKFKAYLDTYPVEVILNRGSWAPSESVGRGMLVIPPAGSVVVEATGATEYTLQFREVSTGGSGGGSLDLRVGTLESSDTAQDALLSDLQSQINSLVVIGDSSVEAAAARSSFLGWVDTTLKARLDRMETNIGVNICNGSDGAVGDGLTDDTDAIRARIALAEAFDLPVIFPPCVDHYMLRGTLMLKKSTRVFGLPGAKLKKFPAVTSAVTAAISIGDTIIPVADASGFVVGHDIVVGFLASGPSYNNTLGVITAVDTVGNTVTIQSYNHASGGMRTAFAEGTAIASMSFPMISTNNIVTPGVKISPWIEGLEFNGNAQPGECEGYTLSSIHIDAAHSVAPRILHCISRNSPADGFSDQSDGDAIIMFNRVYQAKIHGIHKGFTNTRDRIQFNLSSGNGVDGYFWCFGCTAEQVSNNVAIDCPIGFNEIGGDDRDNILIGNITMSCGVDYRLTNDSGVTVIEGFVSIGNTSKVVSIDNSRRFSIKGVARGGLGLGVEVVRSSHGTIAVDWHDWSGPYCVDICNAAAARSSKIRVSGLFNGGATTQPVRVQSSDKVLISDYIFDCGGAADVVISADAGQPAADATHVGFGIRNAGISDGGTNTVDAMV